MTLINALLFFIIALVYSSAGFGGGSMYLAVLSQFSYSEFFVRFVGLSCNTVVTATGAINFHLKKWIPWKPLSGLLLCSVPFCMWSASIKLKSATYFIMLGSCLLLAGIMMLFQASQNKMHTEGERLSNGQHKIVNPLWLYPVAALIGFISGFTGIGGGVYLSPLLYLVRWGSAKHIAAASCVFILINSVAGLLIQYFTQDHHWEANPLWLLLAVFAGGFIGSRVSVSFLSQAVVRYITVSLIIFAAVRILSRYI